MKAVIFLCVCVTAVISAPSKTEEARLAVAARRALPALLHEEVHDKFGQYSLRYITAEGIVVSETGELVPAHNGSLVLVKKGEVSYIGDDGKTYATKYSAGLSGYKAEGDHIPKVPVVSAAPVGRA